MKKKKLFVFIVSMMLIMTFVSVSAMQTQSNNEKDKVNPKIDGPMEKITFIHYKDGTMQAYGKLKARGDPCYKLLGVKWSTLPINYVINPGIYDEAFVTNAINLSINAWDDATSKSIFNTFTIDSSAAWGVYDGKNSYVFGPYSTDNVIAVTNIWYTSYTNRIVDYDVLFNTHFNWGDVTTNLTLMDLQNIATHETGHGLGLADLYTSSCSAVTMYGYSWNGDIEKRTLAQSDILGLQRIYGI